MKVLIDSKALFSIIGSEMDWVEDKLNQRFVFRNPNISMYSRTRSQGILLTIYRGTMRLRRVLYGLDRSLLPRIIVHEHCTGIGKAFGKDTSISIRAELPHTYLENERLSYLDDFTTQRFQRA